MNKWNVCNLVFAFILQNKFKKFHTIISKYYWRNPNLAKKRLEGLKQLKNKYSKLLALLFNTDLNQKNKVYLPQLNRNIKRELDFFFPENIKQIFPENNSLPR